MQPYLIGITGGIGAGKSVVSEICRLKGFTVYDCDYEARRIMETDSDVIRRLKEAAGTDVYDSEGKLCRETMASRIFGSPEIRDKVNGIVHACVKADVEDRVRNSEEDIIFVESAILSTSGIDSLCDRIWFVDASEDLRLKRVIKRNGTTEEKVRQRMLSQKREFDCLPSEKTDIIVNDGIEALLPRIDSLLNRFLT